MFHEMILLKWAHILAMVYWLGGEWGVFQTSYNVVNRKLALDERRRHMETAYRIDILARSGIILLLPLGLHLGFAAVGEGSQTRIVVLEEKGEVLGLRVSAVEDVANLTESQIEPPDTARICQISNTLFRGVARIGQQPMILLDASELLQCER